MPGRDSRRESPPFSRKLSRRASARAFRQEASDVPSLRKSLRSLPQSAVKRLLSELTEPEAEALLSDWTVWAREDQLEPLGAWRHWLIQAGRGWGKSRTGAEAVRHWATSEHGIRVALVAQTPDEVRKVMIEGEAGLLASSSARQRPHWEPAKGELTWPLVRGHSTKAFVYSGAEPEGLRGPAHHRYWADEFAAWKSAREAFENLDMGLRLGDRPRGVITTTPKPLRLLRELGASKLVHFTRGRTLDNAANLPRSTLDALLARYGGTRLGRQELDGELLDDAPGALWTRALLDELRVKSAPAMTRLVVAIDPAASAGENSDETGIVVAGISDKGHRYVLADLSLRGRPEKWASVAIAAYKEHRADRIIAEKNNGGDMVRSVLLAVDADVPVALVHASRGKRVRAEPVATAYERKRCHHVGVFERLEDQLCSWTPESDESPDRMDALVWAMSALGEGAQAVTAAPEEAQYSGLAGEAM